MSVVSSPKILFRKEKKKPKNHSKINVFLGDVSRTGHATCTTNAGVDNTDDGFSRPNTCSSS